VVLDGLLDYQQKAKDVELSGGVEQKPQQNATFMREAMLGRKKMEISNWGNLLELTRGFITPFLDLPLNKVVTVASEVADDPQTGKPRLYPSLEGKMKYLIKAHFQVVGYTFPTTYQGVPHLCMATQYHESFYTKDRLGLMRVLPEPKFQTFIDANNRKIAPLTEMQVNLARGMVFKLKERPKIEAKRK
ncbi:MAG: hypothetical protein WC291_10110, partial [Thermodesulfovibrionales bacterium]|jgi:hypothetical protein